MTALPYKTKIVSDCFATPAGSLILGRLPSSGKNFFAIRGDLLATGAVDPASYLVVLTPDPNCSVTPFFLGAADFPLDRSRCCLAFGKDWEIDFSFSENTPTFSRNGDSILVLSQSTLFIPINGFFLDITHVDSPYRMSL